MANAKLKPQEKDIEEEIGVVQRTTQQVSSSKQEKRKRDEEIPAESPNKYMHGSDGNRSVTTTTRKQNSLRVPFWKDLNHRQSSAEFHTTEIGTFSLLTRADEKECFEDKRYLRSRYFHRFPFKFI
jgi:hypothetical protein